MAMTPRSAHRSLAGAGAGLAPSGRPLRTLNAAPDSVGRDRDHGEDLWKTFEGDDVLTTAMLHWLPGRILSAARIYYETQNASSESFRRGRVEVPTGYARSPAEPWAPPREVVERGYDLVHYSEPPRGGHFPALEEPEPGSREVAGFFTDLS